MIKLELPNYVQNIITELKNKKTINSIWLIGSRANGTENESSDWDLLVFSVAEPIITKARHKNVDVIILGPSGNYLLEGKKAELKNSFKNWYWSESENNEATYVGNKFIDYPSGVRDISSPVYEKTKSKAYCLWRR